jgi:hypothetical protein
MAFRCVCDGCIIILSVSSIAFVYMICFLGSTLSTSASVDGKYIPLTYPDGS